MSKRVDATITCPGCGRQYPVKLYRTIWGEYERILPYGGNLNMIRVLIQILKVLPECLVQAVSMLPRQEYKIGKSSNVQLIGIIVENSLEALSKK